MWRPASLQAVALDCEGEMQIACIESDDVETAVGISGDYRKDVTFELLSRGYSIAEMDIVIIGECVRWQSTIGTHYIKI
jgi:hypothetical protein